MKNSRQITRRAYSSLILLLVIRGPITATATFNCVQLFTYGFLTNRRENASSPLCLFGNVHF